ncbi:MAG: hypothetical protein HY801_12075 [Candidatus Lindowbacteria bacterium]|nr:hypothetical protein [Candidatus Lindowbacteria bacterium]
MEVRFRPLQASTLAGRVNPGQAGAEGGQSFLEVVESVAGAENSLREKTGGGPHNRNSNRENRDSPCATGLSPLPGANAAETSMPDESDTEKSATTTPLNNVVTDKKSLGLQLDMTA